ncbi:MAG: hypothetical protein ACRDQZ_19755, partial [Mycobacteriales bacterium]
IRPSARPGRAALLTASGGGPMAGRRGRPVQRAGGLLDELAAALGCPVVDLTGRLYVPLLALVPSHPKLRSYHMVAASPDEFPTVLRFLSACHPRTRGCGPM